MAKEQLLHIFKYWSAHLGVVPTTYHIWTHYQLMYCITWYKIRITHNLLWILGNLMSVLFWSSVMTTPCLPNLAYSVSLLILTVWTCDWPENQGTTAFINVCYTRVWMRCFTSFYKFNIISTNFPKFYENTLFKVFFKYKLAKIGFWKKNNTNTWWGK